MCVYTHMKFFCIESIRQLSTGCFSDAESFEILVFFKGQNIFQNVA
jgi:hypothetical protein